MPPLLLHSEDEIARARVLYEETDLSPQDIARMLGISVNSFYRRVKTWGWRRRRLRVAEVDAAAREAALSVDVSARAGAARAIDDLRAAEDRAEDAILGQIAALEAMHERVASAAYNAIDGERGARTIYRLAQALTEVSRARNERAKSERLKEAGEGRRARFEADEPEEDMDAMRNMLAERLERLIAQEAMEREYEEAERDREAGDRDRAGG